MGALNRGFRRFVGIAAVSVALSAPQVAQSETLADALVGAYTHSGLLNQNRALLRAADEDVAIAGAALKPVLRWSADLTQTFSRARADGAAATGRSNGLALTASLIGELLLYDFGTSKFRIEAAKETVLATREVLRSLEQRVLLRAVTAYMGVVEANEFVALRRMWRWPNRSWRRPAAVWRRLRGMCCAPSRNIATLWAASPVALPRRAMCQRWAAMSGRPRPLPCGAIPTCWPPSIRLLPLNCRCWPAKRR